jgi:hypothetical protein
MAHIELLFMWDRDDPESMKNVMEFMRSSSETDILHGFHSEMPGSSPSIMAEKGPLYSNYHIWLGPDPGEIRPEPRIQIPRAKAAASKRRKI